MISPKVFIDMDGVLANFVLGAELAHGREPGSTALLRGALRNFDLQRIWGMGQEEFWAPTNSREFWLGLEEHSEAREIIDLGRSLVGPEDYAILTAPSLFDGCVGAKREWIEKHFPELGKRVIYCPAGAKRLLAHPRALLLDDRSRNVKEWREAGGPAITVPRPWNDKWAWGGHVMNYLRAKAREVRKQWEETV